MDCKQRMLLYIHAAYERKQANGESLFAKKYLIQWLFFSFFHSQTLHNHENVNSCFVAPIDGVLIQPSLSVKETASKTKNIHVSFEGFKQIFEI